MDENNEEYWKKMYLEKKKEYLKLKLKSLKQNKRDENELNNDILSNTKSVYNYLDPNMMEIVL